ncbi:Beta-galactosidase 8 [Glycine soja]|uniref:beta-galactosidase n=1 Tax=Glycine soja TaxID=3848 RepID=A0A445I1S7_GLYSO|nr:Beta-galactosidase 8 [Glycine soja]
MKQFTAKIMDMIKQENLYASQGGPIILCQIENEYRDIYAAYGPAAKSYMKWAASMETSLDTRVPWVLWQQADADAADPIINMCNDFYCDQFTSSNAKPKIWTENWSGCRHFTLVFGKNTIDLLSLTVGLQLFFDTWGAGITGPVILKGLKNGSTLDLSSRKWTCKVGLKGEDLGLSSGSSGQWNSQSTLPTNQPLIWYKTNFVAPSGSNPVAIDFTGMGRGEAWVNGQSIGRYWPTYIGSYNSFKCLKNCGKPSQTLYHVPQSWLQPNRNTLILFEESGRNPMQISFATRQIGSVCSHVSGSHPPPVDLWNSDTESEGKVVPLVSLECPYPNQVISSIKFASFGMPYGTCGNFKHGHCRSNEALSIACIGSSSCRIELSINAFGDPCKGVAKSLAVESSCA